MEEQITQEIKQYLKLLQGIEDCKDMFSALASRGCKRYVPRIGEGIDAGHPLCKDTGHICAIEICPLGGHE